MKEVITLKGFLVKDIKSNPLNPRFIRDKKFEDLKKSIQDFPQMLSLREIIVDENYIVLGGNMRLKALKDLNIKSTDVIMWKGLAEDEKKEFIIKDNANYGTWDWDILANQFDEVALKKYGLDIWQPQEYTEIQVDDFYDNQFKEEEETIREPNENTYESKNVIVVEFDIADYPIAFDLIKKLTVRGADIGALLIEKLISENEYI
jgi:hypothetical protein